jgi:ribosomal protein S18 acetylase RimI-like enzyme
VDQEKRIRQLKPRDRSRIEEMVVSSGNFNDVEIETALELVDEAIKKGDTSGYVFACYCPTPLTQGVYDLYWIVVDPAAQKKGHGRYLLEYVEREVKKQSGRMLLIGTSSQESCGETIRFYERNGYQLAARIKDFYRIGDDKPVFSKVLM